MNLKELLHLYYPVPDKSVKALLEKCVEFKLSKGECAIYQGEHSHYAYFVFDGFYRLSNCMVNGHEDTVCFGSNGVFVASVHSFQYNMPSVFTLEAVTDCTGLKISHRDLHELMDTDNNILRWFAEFAIFQIYCLERRYMLMRNPDATMRYIEFLKIQKDRAKVIPLKYIAQYIGVASETLSRIRAKLLKTNTDTNNL
ncbi:MAG: Crp/Fnr family transcriptional regulator [Candidatus Amulumruptor caecigallinarius]|nr:Crp/Fnr family transcriptional regulator [Candidatus Amulumruptor caecigallinarius]